MTVNQTGRLAYIRRLNLLKAIGTVCTSLLTVAALTPWASAANQSSQVTVVGQPTAPIVIGQESPRHTRLAASDATSAVAESPCEKPGDNLNNRTVACAILQHAIPIKTGKKTGTLQAITTHDITLNIKSLTYTNNVSIRFLRYTGTASIAGLTFSLDANCGGTCTAKESASMQNIPAVVGSSASGTVTFTDTTTTRNLTTDTFTYKAGGVRFTGSIGSVSIPVRCDDELRTQQSAGCVFPKFTPTMDTMKTLPNISANIKRIQSAGHYGEKGVGSPLHRLADTAKRDANRAAVCPRSATPPASDLSCDEYPFASTYEGGTALPASDRGTAWVPSTEQNKQGGQLNAFALANRVLDNDPYWVEV
jgi:Deoxyribonuclease NucA/NucB